MKHIQSLIAVMPFKLATQAGAIISRTMGIRACNQRSMAAKISLMCALPAPSMRKKARSEPWYKKWTMAKHRMYGLRTTWPA